MVFNMAAFFYSWKSLQTIWNASKTILKWFVTACATVCVDLGWIRKGRKLADFEQNAGAIAHDCEHGRFWQLLEIAPNSLKRLQNNSKMIGDCLPTVCVDLGGIRKGRKLTGLEQKVWAAAHGFEHGQLWQVLELTPNSLKRPQNHSKMICDYLRDFLCRFRVNSKRSKIGRFWSKGLGYSQWLWTWPTLSTLGNHSKLSARLPKAF